MSFVVTAVGRQTPAVSYGGGLSRSYSQSNADTHWWDDTKLSKYKLSLIASQLQVKAEHSI